MQVLINVHVEFVLTGRHIYQTKAVGFENTKIIQQQQVEEKEKKEVIINILKSSGGRSFNEEYWLSPCRTAFKVLNETLKKALY